MEKEIYGREFNDANSARYYLSNFRVITVSRPTLLSSESEVSSRSKKIYGAVISKANTPSLQKKIEDDPLISAYLTPAVPHAAFSVDEKAPQEVRQIVQRLLKSGYENSKKVATLTFVREHMNLFLSMVNGGVYDDLPFEISLLKELAQCEAERKMFTDRDVWEKRMKEKVHSLRRLKELELKINEFQPMTEERISGLSDGEAVGLAAICKEYEKLLRDKAQTGLSLGEGNLQLFLYHHPEERF